MIGLFPRTPQQRRTATELANRWGPDAVLVDGGPGPALRRMWSELDAVVLFLPVGAAVRLIAPLLRDERTDPDVVCVDERFAVTLSGGGQVVAEQVAEVLGRLPVVTSGESAGALDELVDLLGAAVDGDLDACAAAVADGAPVLLRNPHGFALPALPENVSATCGRPEWTVVVDDRRPLLPPGEREVRIVPRTLVIGIGTVRGVSRTAVTGAISRLDREHGIDPRAIRAFATAEAKAGERGLLDAVQDLGFWHSADAEELPLRLYPPHVLGQVAVPNPSAAVQAATGTPSVAEAAALRAAAELATEDEARDEAACAGPGGPPPGGPSRAAGGEAFPSRGATGEPSPGEPPSGGLSRDAGGEAFPGGAAGGGLSLDRDTGGEAPAGSAEGPEDDAAALLRAELGAEPGAAPPGPAHGEPGPGHREPSPEHTAELVVPKTSAEGVTVAAARVRPRGRLTVIGLGPGPADLRTPRAEAEIRLAAAVVGREQDLALIAGLVHAGALTRADGAPSTAAELAAEGRSVALVTTGDPAALLAEARAVVPARDVELRLVPGVR